MMTQPLSRRLDEHLSKLLGVYPLPTEWSPPEAVQDTVVAGGVLLYRAGLSVKAPDGEEMVGSAADPERAPVERAYFEMLERAATVEALRTKGSVVRILDEIGHEVGELPPSVAFPDSDAPDQWRYARSNGVALQADWDRACQHAFWELCERDRVLRSWHGEVAPEPLRFSIGETHLGRLAMYDWIVRSFPECERSAFSRGIQVCGIFGLPKATAPFVFGYAARPVLEEALAGAVREATQSLAFLWNEEVPQAPAVFAPTPMYHLETYQRPETHRTIRRWLGGDNARYPPPELEYDPPRSKQGDQVVRYVDLTPTWMFGLRVSKAVCTGALPLIFGGGPFGKHLPQHLRVHPIA